MMCSHYNVLLHQCGMSENGLADDFVVPDKVDLALSGVAVAWKVE